MKVYMQILKYNSLMMPKISIGIVIMMLLTTIYALSLHSDGINLFSENNITITQIVFRLVFTTIMIGIYLQLLLILIGPSASFLQMIPEIRKKTIIFAGLYLCGVFIWAFFILGYSNLHFLLFFTLINFLGLSTITSIARIPVYRSNKFWILELVFTIFSFFAIMLFSESPSNHPVTYFLISTYFIVVSYQIMNFVRNYINYRVKEDFNTKGFGKRMNSLQNILDDIIVRKFRKFVEILKVKAVSDRYGKLFHFTLFGNEFIFPVLIIGLSLGLAYAKLRFHVKPEYLFISVILYSLIFANINIRRIFKQKSKINFLYQKTGLRRKDFEFLVIKTAVKVYFIRMIKIIIPFFAFVFIFTVFFGTADYYFLIYLILSITLIDLTHLYYFWHKMLKNKDYDKLKQLYAIERK